MEVRGRGTLYAGPEKVASVSFSLRVVKGSRGNSVRGELLADDPRALGGAMVKGDLSIKPDKGAAFSIYMGSVEPSRGAATIIKLSPGLPDL